MTDAQKQRLIELAGSVDPATRAALEGVLSALPQGGNELKYLSSFFELARAKCIVKGSATLGHELKFAEVFDDLRRLCWSLWRL